MKVENRLATRAAEGAAQPLEAALLRGYEGKRIGVTGALGFLGASVVSLLAGADCEVVRVARGPASWRGAGRARIVDVIADVREAAAWRLIVPRCDLVFHLAAQTSGVAAAADRDADHAANVAPVTHLLDACRELGTKPTVLFAGTVTQAGIPRRIPVDERHEDLPVTIYDEHKLMAENKLKRAARFGLVRAASLRLANLYGPGPRRGAGDRGVLDAMIARALAGEPLTVFGHGGFVRDYLHVHDAARAFVMAGARIDCLDARHWVVGSETGHTIDEAFRTIAQRVSLRTGKRVRVERVEPAAALSPIERRDFIADSSRFRAATGWRPEWSLAAGIDQTIEELLCASS